MEKINKFSNQMAGSGLSSDYSKEETKRKGKHEKHLDKLEQKKKRLQNWKNNLYSKKRLIEKNQIISELSCLNLYKINIYIYILLVIYFNIQSM